MKAVTTAQIVRWLGFKSSTNKEYVDHVWSVKHEFLRCDHTVVLLGPQALEDAGRVVVWEQGLELLSKAYPEMWDIGRFSGPGERRTHAYAFLMAQLKKARYDIGKEKEAAVAKAKKAAEARAKKEAAAKPITSARTKSQKVRGRKRNRNDSELTSPLQPPPSFARYSSASRHSSPTRYSSMPPPNRQKELPVERPDLRFKSFIVFLKGPQFTQGSYDSLWDFDALLKWILEK